MATQLVPAHAQGRALAVILAGVALASAVGLPVGTLIGQTFTWRTTFGVFAWLSAGILVAAWALLPETPLIRAPGILQQFHLLRKREVISSFGITVTVATGHYMVFTFISPFLEKVYTLHASTSSMFLLVLGVGSIAGNFLGGKAVDKNLPLTLLITLAGLLVVLGLLSISSMHFAWLTILILTWGATSAAVNVGLQYWLVKLVPEAPETVSALNVSFINAGIGLGSALGAFVVQNQGLEKINNYGALLILLALLLFLGTLYIRIRQTNLRKAATCNAVLMVSFFLIVG
jgi:predicted MFS family arabinose efflux permease